MNVNDNYYSCYFNDDATKMLRSSIHDIWGIHFNKEYSDRRKEKTFKEELMYSCELMYNSLRQYTPILNIFFSGGADSEALLNCFVMNKIPVRPVVIIHDAKPDSEETVNALRVCERLNLEPLIMNIDISNIFYTGRATELAEKYQTYYIGLVELLYVMEILKEPIIMGDEVTLLNITRSADMMRKDDYTHTEWHLSLEEDIDGFFNRYEYITGIPVISESFKFTPQCWLALLKTQEFVNLVDTGNKYTSKGIKNKMMAREFEIPFRNKTNVFSTGPYSDIVGKLIKDLTHRLYRTDCIVLPYTQIINTLETYTR